MTYYFHRYLMEAWSFMKEKMFFLSANDLIFQIAK